MREQVLVFFIIDLVSVNGVYSLAITQSTFFSYLSVPTIELGYGNKSASLSLSFPGNVFILLVSSSSLRAAGRSLSLALLSPMLSRGILAAEILFTTYRF